MMSRQLHAYQIHIETFARRQSNINQTHEAFHLRSPKQHSKKHHLPPPLHLLLHQHLPHLPHLPHLHPIALLYLLFTPHHLLLQLFNLLHLYFAHPHLLYLLPRNQQRLPTSHTVQPTQLAYDAVVSTTKQAYIVNTNFPTFACAD